MTRWFLLIFAFFSFANPVFSQPRPLPDDPYPQEPYPGEPQRITYSLGSGESGRFGSKTTQFFPRADLSRVIGIRFVGLRNNIEVKEVRILYGGRGGERNELLLTGDLPVGGVREAFFDGRTIYRIEVTASSEYFWKKLGGYRVDITVVR